MTNFSDAELSAIKDLINHYHDKMFFVGYGAWKCYDIDELILAPPLMSLTKEENETYLIQYNADLAKPFKEWTEDRKIRFMQQNGLYCEQEQQEFLTKLGLVN